VRAARDAGLRGIAVEAGSTIVIDRAGIVVAADEAALFVIGVEPG
jgi:UDP-2,3-diacylglucosamine hydrolase